ncbi:MAG: sodium:alanine symporter family protein [Robiginitomaculum sp.]|nr:MAG: sodium:alanine symporter family protein [Robiginitomaculum sp.]
MASFSEILTKISDILWGSPKSLFGLDIPFLGDLPFLALLLLGTGLYLTAILRFMPILRIPAAFIMLWKGRKTKEGEEGQITPFAALATALSSTVGTGNLAGVATAITLGGPGAIFWMWMTALVGMATKYAESMLAVRYREVDEDGNFKGGPMYYIKNGLGPKWKWLAVLFAFGAMASAVSAGNMVQANGIAEVANEAFKAPPIATGFVLAALAFIVIIGGITSIGKFASKLVPFMAVSYVVAALIVLVLNASGIPAAFKLIFTDAFNGHAAVGGFSGAVVAQAIRFGIARGLFSNEAGQGSAPIAHAAAKTKDPVQQGTIAMLGTFIDTIVICTMTALVILTVKGNFVGVDANGVEQAVSYAWQSNLVGARITSAAFGAGIPGGDWIITFALIIFAFTTILGWSYYGERSISYLLGEKAVFPFRIIWCVFTFCGAILSVQAVWTLGDIGNAVMAAPNLLAVLLLSGVVVSMTRGGEYHRKIQKHDESAHAKGLHNVDGEAP